MWLYCDSITFVSSDVTKAVVLSLTIRFVTSHVTDVAVLWVEVRLFWK